MVSLGPRWMVAVALLPATVRAAEIRWSSYLGGEDSDEALDAVADEDGNVYVVGHTRSADFPASGGFDTTFDGSSDAFVVKLRASGELVWSSYLGGSRDDWANGVTIDASGNLYVVGETYSSDFPVANGFDSTFSERDAFVTKVEASGQSLVWSSFLGGSAADTANEVALDGAGNVVVVGFTDSPDFPSFGGFDTTLGTESGSYLHDGFVTKIAASGRSLLWSSYLGDYPDDHAEGVAVDVEGHIYVVGHTESPDFDGWCDDIYRELTAFVTKVDADGALDWSSCPGGGGASGVAVDETGGVYVVGGTRSSDFPAAGGFDATLDGPSDGFVGKVAPDGTLEWSSFLGGSAIDWALDVSPAPGGSLYVAGISRSTDFPAGEGPSPTFAGGDGDAFIAKVHTEGPTLLWSVLVGGSDSDYGQGIASNGRGDVFVVGPTSSSDLPSSGGFDTTLGGYEDSFIAYVRLCGDGVCEAGEDCGACAEDCGPCPEPIPDLGPAGADLGLADGEGRAGPSAAPRPGCDCGISRSPGSSGPIAPLLLAALLFARGRRARRAL